MKHYTVSHAYDAIALVADANHGAWRANFYKCGDDTSHPHWAAWSPLKKVNNPAQRAGH